MPCNARIDAPGATANLNTFELALSLPISCCHHFSQVEDSTHLAPVMWVMNKKYTAFQINL